MSDHLTREGFLALLGGELEAQAEADFLAHLHAEPDCGECGALLEGMSDEEEQALGVLMAKVERARDPGDAWQARALAGAGSSPRAFWRWAAVGLGLCLVLLVSVGLWLFRPGPGAGSEDSILNS